MIKAKVYSCHRERNCYTLNSSPLKDVAQQLHTYHTNAKENRCKKLLSRIIDKEVFLYGYNVE